MALGASLRRALTLWRMPSRATLGIVGGLVLVLALVWVLAWRHASQLPDSLRWFGVPEFSGVSVGPLGTVTYTDFRLSGVDAREPDVFAAARVVLETPGLHWLAWHGLFGGPSSGGLAEFAGPSRLARVAQSGGVPAAFPPAGRLYVRAEGLQAGPGLAVGDLRWIGLASGAPLDGEGCDGIGRFDAAQLAEMGLGEAPTVAEARFEATARDSARLQLSIEHDSASRVELDMTVRADVVRGLLDADWSRTVILDRRWTVRDLGFVSARNRWCAQRMGISRDGFVDRHLAAIKRDLAAAGLAPTRDLESAYRRYAARGGEMTWHSRPTLTTPVGQLSTFAVGERLRILNASLESVRGRAAAFRFDAAPPPEPVFSLVGPPAPEQPTVDGALASPPDAAGAVAAPVDPAAGGVTASVAALAATGGGNRASTAPAPAPVPAASAQTPTPAPVVPLPATPAPAPADGGPRPVGAGAPIAGMRSVVPVSPAASLPPPDVPADTPAPAGLARVEPAPAIGASLRYADLARLEGRRIEVRSVYGSLRRGTLEKYTDTAITIRLEQRERGLTVTMPQQTVEGVRLLEARPLLDDPLPPG